MYTDSDNDSFFTNTLVKKPIDEDIKYVDDVDKYDLMRTIVGIEYLKPLFKENVIRVLDAGCGTGNYIKELNNDNCQFIGIDNNAEMVKKTVEKIKEFDLNALIFLGSLNDPLPFPSESFDGVMINQVLDYLDDGSDKSFPNCKKIFAEFHRIIRPGGFLAINFSTPEQAESFWYNYLVPNMMKQFKKRHISKDLLVKYLTQNNFTVKSTFKIVDSTMKKINYNNIIGALNSDWRKGDTNWIYANEKSIDELNELLHRSVNHYDPDLPNEAKYPLFITLDRVRQEIGQSLTIIAIRK